MAEQLKKRVYSLRERLRDFCVTMEQYRPDQRIENWRTHWAEKWKEIIFKAWFNRVNLSVAELYKSPHYKGPPIIIQRQAISLFLIWELQ